MTAFRVRNAVRSGSAGTFFTCVESDRPWPVYLLLERLSGDAYVHQYEPGWGPRAVADGRASWWQIGTVPSRKEAYALVRDLKPLLQAELRDPGSADAEIGERCQMFDSQASFALAVEVLLDEEWFHADGRPGDLWDGDIVRIALHGEITAKTSDRRLQTIATSIRKTMRPTTVVDLDRHLQNIRQHLIENSEN